jgi:hypothetical protein
LAEKHSHELAPTGKAASVALGFVLANCSLKLDSRKQLQQLTENAAYSIHGGSLAWVIWFCREPISPLQRLTKPGLFWLSERLYTHSAYATQVNCLDRRHFGSKLATLSSVPAYLSLRGGSTEPAPGSQPAHRGGNMQSRTLTWFAATVLFVALALPLQLAAQGQK